MQSENAQAGGTICVIEDDPELADFMVRRLRTAGYRVFHESNGVLAVSLILREQPDGIILDLMLPGIDGIEVLKQIRPRYSGPVLMLTAKDEDQSHILGLEAGADDYVTKPIHPRVLLARLQALLRRFVKSGGVDGQSIAFGGLTIDAGRREVRWETTVIQLTSSEFDLFWYLCNRPGTVLDRETIYRELYQTQYDGYDRAVDVYVSRIRQKLVKAIGEPTLPVTLKTVRGKGYLLAVKERA
ncbi:response regulator transcription factor [Acanthopleuribacter pedis]|uniref:Response regulator transcription factor n=1 Tax=Acanthopleuribacter pedis TaxID=442870 RepID=A0A8J7U6J1_9BACT|nr:response regulator transcription factor [Acanthopleuribacter pedis]MBO1321508.1 response regulator transcription factor [Acanthopleuribacter pedis]